MSLISFLCSTQQLRRVSGYSLDMDSFNFPSVGEINKMNKDALKTMLCELAELSKIDPEIADLQDGNSTMTPSQLHAIDRDSDVNSQTNNDFNVLQIQVQELVKSNKKLVAMLLKQQEVVEQLATTQNSVTSSLDSLTGNMQKIMISMDIEDEEEDSDLEDEEDGDPQENLLIGDNMIRDITSTSENLTVTCMNGAMVNTIRKSLKSAKKRNYKDLVILCGTNDAATNKSNDKILKDFENLIHLAKEKAAHVSLSSIIPRLDEKLPENKRDDLNKKLKIVCELADVAFINNDLSFKYAGGAVDESLISPTDKLHLTQQGSRRLLGNLKMTNQAYVSLGNLPGAHENNKGWQTRKNRGNSQFTDPLPIPTEPKPPQQVKKTTEASKKVIYFRGAKSSFSNFYMTPIDAWGQRFQSTEHGYAYYKALEMKEPAKAEEILQAPNARLAKSIGDKVETNQHWQQIKQGVMYHLLQQKAKQCRKFNLDLSATKDNALVEDTEHEYWGRGKEGEGQNILGRLLMTVRSKLPEVPSRQQLANLPDANPRNRPPSAQNYQNRPPSAQNYQNYHAKRQRFTPMPNAIPQRWTNGRNRPANPQEQQNCFNCGERSHTIANCRHSYPLECYSCSGIGHKQKFCPWSDSHY